MSTAGFTHARPSVGTNLLNHEGRLRGAETNDRSGDWVYVDDGSGNPLFVPYSPAFQNSWTNVGSPYHLVSFKRFDNWIHLRGAFTGGADGTVIFTLPLGWLPGAVEPLLLSLTDGTGACTVRVDPSGDVTFVQNL